MGSGRTDFEQAGVDGGGSRHNLVAMATIDECLVQLKALAASKDPAALEQAGTHIDAYVIAQRFAPQAAINALGELQARFQRETDASLPMRSDILDLMSARVMRLLESDGSGE